MPIIKRLFFDIEVSPNIGFFWQPGYKINLTYDNIIQERAIICICYKWEGKSKVSSLSWERGDDKKMLKEFLKVVNTADELVGHNGDNFDLKWIRTRCLFHNIPVFPNYTTIDTLKFARSKFRFNSNRLDYLGKFMGLGEKLHTSFELWKGIVLKNDPVKLKKMIKYCKQDVKLLEAVFSRLNNYLPPKTHAGIKAGKCKGTCPECASENLRVNMYRNTLSGRRVQLRCGDCGKTHQVSEKEIK